MDEFEKTLIEEWWFPLYCSLMLGDSGLKSPEGVGLLRREVFALRQVSLEVI
jgi:hypothetical protein